MARVFLTGTERRGFANGVENIGILLTSGARELAREEPATEAIERAQLEELQRLHERLGALLAAVEPAPAVLPSGYKVYGLEILSPDSHRQVRAIVAARSWRAAAEALGVNAGWAQKWGSVTGNAEELEIAAREPGKAWYISGGVWYPYERRS